MGVHFLNGSFVTEEKLLISPRDTGFSRGYAVFDFLRTYNNGQPFKLREHIDRLYRSADAIGLVVPWSKDRVEAWVHETLAANEGDEKFIKIIISGGISNTMLPGEHPSIIILIDPAVEYPKEMYEKGAGLITVKHTRYCPEAKSNNYIEGVKQSQIARATGAVEPLYYSDDQVYEGSNSNVFALIGGKLMTPKTNILGGITRGVLLENLRLTVPIEVEDFTIDELRGAKEIFLSASGKEIVPVTILDGKKVGDGKVGAITKEVSRQFSKLTLGS